MLELSCEQLYMACVDSESSTTLGSAEGPTDPPWDGEPTTEIAKPATEDIFADLARRLADADVLRVIGTEWLSGAAFGGRVDALLDAYRERGGRVELSGSVVVDS